MSDTQTEAPARPDRMIVNGDLVPFAAATVHLMSPAMRYGLNISEGLRGYWNSGDQELYVFRLAEHMDRFMHSMKMLRFAPEFDVATVTDAIPRLLRADAHKANCHIRATAYLDGIGEHHVTKPVS
jgi:branched-chain amino acid aminotransferase